MANLRTPVPDGEGAAYMPLLRHDLKALVAAKLDAFVYGRLGLLRAELRRRRWRGGAMRPQVAGSG